MLGGSGIALSNIFSNIPNPTRILVRFGITLVQIGISWFVLGETGIPIYTRLKLEFGFLLGQTRIPICPKEDSESPWIRISPVTYIWRDNFTNNINNVNKNIAWWILGFSQGKREIADRAGKYALERTTNDLSLQTVAN